MLIGLCVDFGLWSTHLNLSKVEHSRASYIDLAVIVLVIFGCKFNAFRHIDVGVGPIFFGRYMELGHVVCNRNFDVGHVLHR